jgi:hypothetical protein
MIVHLTITDEGVEIRVRAEGGGLLGDFTTTLEPGQSALGKPYEWWVGLGDGEHEIGGES